LSEWHFAQQDSADELCILQHFAMKKRQPSAQSDKQTNQQTTPFTPSGWGPTLLTALAECIRAIHRFPYEP
jgi:hypothetical protein